MAIFENVPYTNFQDLNLDYLIKTVKYVEKVASRIEELRPEFEELQDFMRNINSGIFPEGFEETLRIWCAENVHKILSTAIQMVWFGLTMDGHFVAYIPDNWDDITFDTIMDYESADYGRLVLKTNVYNTYNYGGI